MPHSEVRPPAVCLDVVNIKLRDLRKKLGHSEIEVFKYQTWYQAEVRRSQTFQQGFEVQQQKCISLFEDHDQEMAILRQDLELAEKLIVTQKEMIDQQQESASRPVPVGPLLPNYNDQNQPYYQTYFQPPRNQEFIIDPTGLRQIDNYDYNIGTSMDSSCGTQPVMTNTVPELDQQTSVSSMPSILQPVSAERDVEVPANTGEGFKRASEDEGSKPNKKRRMK
jgi:hypothetical protein